MRILITGACGAGASTLALTLASHLGWPCLDGDDYLWRTAAPPFQDKRSAEERRALLGRDLLQGLAQQLHAAER